MADNNRGRGGGKGGGHGGQNGPPNNNSAAPGGGDDIIRPAVEPVQVIDPPGNVQPAKVYVHNDDGISENIKTYINEALNRNYNRLVEVNDNNQKLLEDRLDLRWNTFKEAYDNRLMAMDVDIADIKKRVSQLEKALNESVNLSKTIQGYDSLNMTFQNRMIVQALNNPDYVQKNKAKAPDKMKYALSEFKGPQGNENWINVREHTLTDYENSLLDKFPIIADRAELLRPLRGATPEGREAQWHNEMDFRDLCFDAGMLWDSDFQRDTRPWDGTGEFDAWFAHLWRNAEHNKIDDPQLFKNTLYAKIKHLVDLITPQMDRTLSALRYYLQVRRQVIPYTY